MPIIKKNVVKAEEGNDSNRSKDDASETIQTSRLHRRASSSCSFSSSDFFFRGLESYEESSFLRKLSARTEAANVVFDVEHDGGDQETIAACYSAVTSASQSRAYAVGLSDWREAESCYKNSDDCSSDDDEEEEVDDDFIDCHYIDGGEIIEDFATKSSIDNGVAKTTDRSLER